MAILSVKGEALPSPVSIQIDDELIWSSESGRDLSGLFAGDIIAQKKAVKLIQEKLCAGYFPVTFWDTGQFLTIEAYRGTLSKVALGQIGDGIFYYKSVSCKIVQR